MAPGAGASEYGRSARSGAPSLAPSSLGALTATVFPSPLNARRTPNQSSFPVFEALMKACWDHGSRYQ